VIVGTSAVLGGRLSFGSGFLGGRGKAAAAEGASGPRLAGATAAPEDGVTALAEGAAVAPYRSMIRYVLGKGLPNSLALLYAEKAPDRILFRQELAGFPRQGVPVVITITDPPSPSAKEAWDGPTGPITAESLRRAAGRLKDHVYYIRGPATFVRAMRTLLVRAGVEPDQLRAHGGDLS